MLILQTANGRIPIAKGNLYKITEENGQLIYITKDRIAIPVTKMNGVDNCFSQLCLTYLIK